MTNYRPRTDVSSRSVPLKGVKITFKPIRINRTNKTLDIYILTRRRTYSEKVQHQARETSTAQLSREGAKLKCRPSALSTTKAQATNTARTTTAKETTAVLSVIHPMIWKAFEKSRLKSLPIESKESKRPSAERYPEVRGGKAQAPPRNGKLRGWPLQSRFSKFPAPQLLIQ